MDFSGVGNVSGSIYPYTNRTQKTIGNNTNPIMGKDTTKVQKENNQTKEKYMTGQSVKLSISNEGMEYYCNRIQQNGQETYDDVLRRRELLKGEKIRDIDYSYEISKRAVEWNKEATNTGRNDLTIAERADGYVAAYKELYDEIVQGYASGTREIYVADEKGTHKLTKEEELGKLDAAYKKTVDDFVTRETTNQYARAIIGKEMDKISKITARSSRA